VLSLEWPLLVVFLQFGFLEEMLLSLILVVLSLNSWYNSLIVSLFG